MIQAVCCAVFEQLARQHALAAGPRKSAFYGREHRWRHR